MDSRQFYDELMNNVRLRAERDSDFTESAFLQEAMERLTDAEEVDDLTEVHFRAGAGKRVLAVSAYEEDENDDSIVLALTHFEVSAGVKTLTDAEARRQFSAVQNYIKESLRGTFQDGREESTEEYYLAEKIRQRARGVTRYRIYLLTNKVLTSRSKDFPSTEVDGIPVEFHVWDIERFRRVYESTLGREELVIDVTEWVPGGVSALEAPSAHKDTTTLLCVLPARLLADLYGRYGGRLLQSNVRAFLSNRGKVNRGIRETVLSKPELFLAYNNGVTATATSVDLKGSSIIRVTDLQIVNGGQTTASLFYALRERKLATQFDEAHVQAKLVVVSPELAQEMVPNISRFANSQNRISEADFFSSSPFHIRLEDISRRLLTPPRPGTSFQSKWFYERARGQYASEKAKLSRGDRDKFAAKYPARQVITKTDAAKYVMSWKRKPHVVSLGAQKNFAAFAAEVAPAWEASSESFNDSYFRDLVAQAILFNSIRAAVAKQPWYDKGYLAQMVTYTVAKIADVVARGDRGKFSFDAIWQRQALSDATLRFALEVARQVLLVLDAPTRQKANVTEWAKSEECWKQVQALRIAVPDDFTSELVYGDHVRSEKRAAKAQQAMDDGIRVQAEVLEIPSSEWQAIQQFSQRNRLLTPTDAALLGMVIRQPRDLPSERQAARLMQIRQKAVANGYEHDRA